MKELNAREVQLGELSILKKMAQICEDLGLRYFLMYGTLLGAIRHQGFIPWDDDIDVAMPRPDYDKLMEYLISHEKEIYPLKLMNCNTNEDYIYPISRLCDTRYHIDYQGTVDYGLGLFVDIYPLDGCGDTPEQVKALARKNRMLANLTFQAGMKKFEASGTALWRTPIKFAMYCYAKLRGARYFTGKLERNSKSIPYASSRLVNCTIWDVLDFGIERAWLDEYIYVPFEDASLRVPKDYDEVLKLFYGDYMQLPPEEDRVGHHYYTAYLKDEME
jgi:lipopolysaccharide cholinephosphotransferase